MSSSTNCGSISLTKLTPCNCTEKQDAKRLKNVLQKHVNILELTLDAIRSFQKGVMPDPLVGENACQIRAAIYTRIASDQSAMQELNELATKVEQAIAKLSLLKIDSKRVASLNEVLDENGANLQAPSSICPIVHGHILTISKQSDLSIKKESEGDLLPKICLVEKNDPQKVRKFSVSAAKELITIARQSLSELSIQYLRDEASLLAIDGPKDVITDHLKLQTSPCLPGMKILLGSMKARGIPIVLKNRIIDAEGQEKGTVALLCKGDNQGFEIVEPNVKDRDRPAMIIETASISSKSRTKEMLKAEMSAVGVEQLILANFATHTQYGGVSKQIEPPKSDEKEKLKAVALDKGLCEKNPDLCQIYHIFAARIGSHIHEVE